MKRNNFQCYDINKLYIIIEDMAVYICYLESILDMYGIEYDKCDF